MCLDALITSPPHWAKFKNVNVKKTAPLEFFTADELGPFLKRMRNFSYRAIGT